MSKLSDNYPAMDADSCDFNGIMGNCGPDCSALAVGKCPEAEGWFRAAVYVAVNYPESLDGN